MLVLASTSINPLYILIDLAGSNHFNRFELWVTVEVYNAGW